MSQVSIILPVYNSETTIEASVKSILSQSFSDFEFIIINDGSNDGTEQIINSFKDKRIKHIKNVKNIGLIASLNIGIKFSNSEYVARMDGDDISHPSRLKKQILFLKNNPKIDIVGTGIFIIDKNNKILKKKYFPKNDKLIKLTMPLYCCVCHASVVMKKSLFTDIGYYNYNYKYVEDYALWLRAFQKNKFFFNMPELLYYVRENSLSVTKLNKNLNQSRGARIALDFYYKVFKKKYNFKTFECFFSQGQKNKKKIINTTLILFNYFINILKKFITRELTVLEFIYLEFNIIKRGVIIFFYKIIS
jgi:glycosyltransferase involved in cell wall biosynthesis